jgi:hypothetical protein
MADMAKEVLLDIKTAFQCRCGNYHGEVNGKKHEPLCGEGNTDNVSFALNGNKVPYENATYAIHWSGMSVSIAALGPVFKVTFPGRSTVNADLRAELGSMQDEDWKKMISAVPDILDGVPPRESTLEGDEWVKYQLNRIAVTDANLRRACAGLQMRPTKFAATACSFSAGHCMICNLWLDGNKLQILIKGQKMVTFEGASPWQQLMPVVIAGVKIELNGSTVTKQ